MAKKSKPNREISYLAKDHGDTGFLLIEYEGCIDNGSDVRLKK